MKKKYESANMQVFNSVKKVNRVKIIKKRFVMAMIPIVAGLGVAFALATPYMNSASTINEFVEVNHDDIAYVEDESYDSSQKAADELLDEKSSTGEKVEDNIPWGEVPSDLVFDENVVGYLSDEGDVLDNVYPITQSSLDNPNYYIDHDVNGEYNEFGNMYKDSYNNNGLRDDCTVIYGHNLINGSMFGMLKNYADKSGYLENIVGQDLYDRQKEEYGKDGNNFIYIDEYGKYRLDVVYAGVYDGKQVLSYVGNFDNDTDKEAAIKFFREGSDIKSDVKLDKDSRMVIFQTCEDGDSDTYEVDDKRIYVICKVTQLVKYKEFDDVKESGWKSLS